MAKNNASKKNTSPKEPKAPGSNVKNKITPTPPAEMFAQEETTETNAPPATPEVETPADAPVVPSTTSEGPEVANGSRPAEPEATVTKNKITPAAPARTEESAGEQPVAENPAPQAAPEPAKKEVYIGPGSPHSDEQKLERYLKNRNNITKLTNIQLSQSGINMSKIGLLVGRVGKFKLKRDFVVESWKITIEE